MRHALFFTTAATAFGLGATTNAAAQTIAPVLHETNPAGTSSAPTDPVTSGNTAQLPAQDDGAAPADAASAVHQPGDGEIIVTARKRAETAQSIPISIQAVSQQALTQTGSVNLLDLPKVAPGLTLVRAPNVNEVGITIRGLGTGAGVPSFDSSVSLFVDGVYAPRSREFSAALFDVARIEVISGTQAALLGKNTSLGAVNLITRKPGDRIEADASASYEFNYNSRTLTGGFDLPIGDRLQIRISGLVDHIGGYVKDIITGHDGISSNDDAVRGVAVWKPIDAIHVTAVAQHFAGHNVGTATEQIQSDGTPELLANLAGYPGSEEARLDRRSESSLYTDGGDQSEHLKVDKFSLTTDISIGEHTLTGVTAYSDYSEHATVDLDYVPGGYGIQGLDETGHQFSQELRLVSPAGHRFEYLIGGLYLNGTLNNHNVYATNYPFLIAPGVPFAGSELTNFFQRTKDYSGFAQGTFTIIDGLKATGGIRYTHERKSVDLDRVALVPGFFSAAVFPPYAPATIERSENDFDYSGGLQYNINRTALVYASYGKGTKGGGFASSVTELDKTEYGREISRTAEVGVKLSDPARKWLFNLSLFNTRVDGFQVVSFNGTAFVIANADLKSRGFELQAFYYPVRWARLFVNNVYADASDRHTGDPIPLAPKWSGNGGFNVDLGLPTVAGYAGLRFKLDGSVDWRTKRYYHQDPLTSPPGGSFVTYNLGAAVADASDHYELRVIGRNLSNANSISFDFPTPFIPAGNQSGISERGRTIALQLSVKY